MKRFTYLAFLLIVIVSTMAISSSANASAYVRSSCRKHGPEQGESLNVCVRIRIMNNPTTGIPMVYGRGGLDATGDDADHVFVQIRALHIRMYRLSDGALVGRKTTTAGYGWDYYADSTDEGLPIRCGYGYRAVMSYRYSFPVPLSAAVTKTNFRTSLWKAPC